MYCNPSQIPITEETISPMVEPAIVILLNILPNVSNYMHKLGVLLWDKRASKRNQPIPEHPASEPRTTLDLKLELVKETLYP